MNVKRLADLDSGLSQPLKSDSIQLVKLDRYILRRNQGINTGGMSFYPHIKNIATKKELSLCFGAVFGIMLLIKVDSPPPDKKERLSWKTISMLSSLDNPFNMR